MVLTRIARRLLRRPQSQLVVVSDDGSGSKVLYESIQRVESPHWSHDGSYLMFNADGHLWTLPADGKDSPKRFNTASVCNIGNDHLFAPDGSAVYFTAMSALFAVPATGGVPTRIAPANNDTHLQYYIHGVTPDGQRLACIVFDPRSAIGGTSIHLLNTDGTNEHAITNFAAAVDGAEFSRDGNWIYFNSEMNAHRAGDSQIYRMRCDGSDIQQLTFDDRVNWFPHISPGDERLLYLSYPQYTLGHPANCAVQLHCMNLNDRSIRVIAEFRGGQGSVNTNCWSPDGSRIAYVQYS
jgi:Tol biopolymer transport system component